MKTKITPRILSGFMELLPDEQIAFNRMKDIIQNAYEQAGFVPLDTPALELSEVLLAKAGGETEKQIYRFSKGETDMCLRFDLTVPLSRYVAQHQNELAFPFRRYQISKSYRGERPQKGRFREFYQADIDIIGSGSLPVLYDAEIPFLMYQIFQKLGLKRFHIHFNNRKILLGFYEHLGLLAQAADILHLVDKMDKIGVDAVRSCLIELGISPDKTEQILSFVAITGDVDTILSHLQALNIQNESFQTGYDELSTVAHALEKMGLPQTHFMIDLKITRGLDYYTGTVYETYADDFPQWSAICSGGRYENLAQNYTDRLLPGVGMSIGLTRLFDLLRDEGMISKGPQTMADVLILPMGDVMDDVLKQSSCLRASGIRAEVYFADTKFKNKMMYANKIQVPFVAIIGEDEVKQDKITLKNMVTGAQEMVSVSVAIDMILSDRLTKSQQPVILEK